MERIKFLFLSPAHGLYPVFREIEAFSLLNLSFSL